MNNLPIEIISKILEYLLDKKNHLDLLILNKEIHKYFYKYYAKLIKNIKYKYVFIKKYNNFDLCKYQNKKTYYVILLYNPIIDLGEGFKVLRIYYDTKMNIHTVLIKKNNDNTIYGFLYGKNKINIININYLVINETYKNSKILLPILIRKQIVI